jgi:RNA polymerase sigma-70 factor (ECF subfamily)
MPGQSVRGGIGTWLPGGAWLLLSTAWGDDYRGRPASKMDPTPSADLTIRDLYDEYEARLHRYALNLARDHDRADDLVQETMIRAMGNLVLLRQLNRYQRQAWMYRVLKNLFIDQERARQRREVLAERLARQTEPESDPMAAMMARELMGQIPERYRDLLHKRYLLGRTSVEIGHELGIPAATVRSRLYLARKWLRTHYPEDA